MVKYLKATRRRWKAGPSSPRVAQKPPPHGPPSNPQLLTSTTAKEVSQEKLVFLGLSLDLEGAVLGEVMLAVEVCEIHPQLTSSFREWQGTVKAQPLR